MMGKFMEWIQKRLSREIIIKPTMANKMTSLSKQLQRIQENSMLDMAQGLRRLDPGLCLPRKLKAGFLYAARIYD